MNNVLRRGISFTVLALLLGMSSTPAWAELKTSRSTSFGDSLTDNIYLHFIFGTDPDIYGADPFEAMYEKAALSGDTLTSYAVLGSTSADVLAQVNAYVSARKADAIEASTLVSIQGGANDFLDPANLAILGASPPGADGAADAIVNNIRRNLQKSVQAIKKVDRAQVIIWTVPDVTLLPYAMYYGPGGAPAHNVRLHIERLNNYIHLMSNRQEVAVLDISSILTAAIFSPPVIAGTPLLPPPYMGVSYAIFADVLHPTAVSNAIIANMLIMTVNRDFDDFIPVYSEKELAELAGLLPAQ